MIRTNKERIHDLAAYLGVTRAGNRRRDNITRSVMNYAQALRPAIGLVRATDYALSNGAPAHVVKRLLHDA